MIQAAESSKKAAAKNRFQEQKQNIILDEEKTKKVKQRRQKGGILCGTVEPIRVASYVTNPPFGWVNVIPGTGMKKTQYRNAGFSYDLFEQVAKNLKFRVENVGFPSYQEALRALRFGKVDVIAGVYYDKRVLGVGTNLMFPGYFVNPIIPLFVKGKEKQIQKWEDLRGLKGVVRQEEMIYSLVFQQLPKDLKIEQVSGSKKAFRKLITGEADYLLTSLYAGEAEVRRYKLVDEIYFSPNSLVSPEMFFVFSSHSDCRLLKSKLAAELKKILADDKTLKNAIVGYIDDWGQRFKENPSLIEEIRAEQEQAQLEAQTTTRIADSVEFVESEESKKYEASDFEDNTETPSHTDNSSTHSDTPSAAESSPNRPLSAAERIRNL